MTPASLIGDVPAMIDVKSYEQRMWEVVSLRFDERN